MGGSLTVVVRDENRNVHIRETWTNPIPFFVSAEKFINKEWAHFQKLLGDYPELPSIEPVEYGVLVFDLPTNQILSCQGYTDLRRTSSAGIHMTLLAEGPPKEWIRWFFENNRFGDLKEMHPNPEDNRIRPLPNTYEEFVNLCGDIRHFTEIPMDLSPWTVIDFGTDPRDTKGQELRQTLLDMGFEVPEWEDEDFEDE